MTRDANKQSVETCKYEHLWIKDGDKRNPITGDFAVKCGKCGAIPKGKAAEAAKAIVDLCEFIKPGDTIYTTLRTVSRSGMQRVIDVHIIQDSEPRWIGYTVAKAEERRFDDRKQGIIVGGGMDMGFEVVYNLGRILFPEFECVGEGDGYATRCPSNDHSNGDRNYKPHKHSDGGYALKQRWL